MPVKLLLVEDEPAVRDMLKYALAGDQYDVREAGTANRALEIINDDRPDIILLDWMLPGMSGIELTRTLKRDEDLRAIPIILLTARAQEDDKVLGLDAGADDYVTKPFSTREIKSRINALLRRAAFGEPEVALEVAGLRIDGASHRVTIDDQPIDIGPTEFRLLHFFVTHPERVFTRTQLLDNVWGRNVYVEERTVDVHIRRLRKALSPSGYDDLIQTVRTVGYRFSPQVKQ